MWNWGSLVHVHLCWIFCTYCSKAFRNFTHFLYEFKSKCIYFEFDFVFKIFALKPVRLFLYDLFSIWLLACVFWLDADEALHALQVLVAFVTFQALVFLAGFSNTPGSRGLLYVLSSWFNCALTRRSRFSQSSIYLTASALFASARRARHLHLGLSPELLHSRVLFSCLILGAKVAKDNFCVLNTLKPCYCYL